MKKEKLSVYVIFSENILEKQANRSLNRYIFFLFPIKRGYNAMPQKIDYVELTFHNCPRALPWAIYVLAFQAVGMSKCGM